MNPISKKELGLKISALIADIEDPSLLKEQGWNDDQCKDYFIDEIQEIGPYIMAKYSDPYYNCDE